MQQWQQTYRVSIGVVLVLDRRNWYGSMAIDAENEIFWLFSSDTFSFYITNNFFYIKSATATAEVDGDPNKLSFAAFQVFFVDLLFKKGQIN